MGGLLVTTAVLVGAGDPAAASCAPLPSLEERLRTAAVVFVGTVVATSGSDRVAVVAVEEVWKGPALPDRVEVRGSSAPDTDLFTSVDRIFRSGVRYLFVPPDETGVPPRPNDRSPFDDNDCSLTQEWRPELASYRPSPAPATTLTVTTRPVATTVATTTGPSTTSSAAPTTVPVPSTAPATTSSSVTGDLALAAADDGEGPWAWAAVAATVILLAGAAVAGLRLRRGPR